MIAKVAVLAGALLLAGAGVYTYANKGICPGGADSTGKSCCPATEAAEAAAPVAGVASSDATTVNAAPIPANSTPAAFAKDGCCGMKAPVAVAASENCAELMAKCAACADCQKHGKTMANANCAGCVAACKAECKELKTDCAAACSEKKAACCPEKAAGAKNAE